VLVTIISLTIRCSIRMLKKNRAAKWRFVQKMARNLMHPFPAKGSQEWPRREAKPG
jgi:hypothetical protein